MTPTHILDDLRSQKSPHGTVMAVSMMKDEAPFLLEWVAHHLAIGFTDILVYTNDCSDGTVDMLQRLETLGLAYHRENTIAEGIKPQPSALKHAQVEPLVQNADWLMVFDADEFLVLGHPSGHLNGMLDDTVAQDANGVVVTWRIFGSNDVIDWSRAPVSEQYTKAAPPLWNKGWGVKTLFKFDADYWKLGIHRPSIKNKHLETEFPDTVKWLNGSGVPMEDYFKFRGWRSIQRTVGYDWAQMNHYAVKSVDSYAVRKFRGNVNNKKDKYNSDYWALQDRNEVEDTSILRHAPRRAQIMDALLADPVLGDLHTRALHKVETRLTDYKQTPAYAELKDGLVQAGKIPITDVQAKPPKARDPAKIAAQMSKFEKLAHDDIKPDKAANRNEKATIYIDTINDLSDDMDITWAENHNIQLPADPRVFSPLALNTILSGRFDRRNARNIESYVDGYTRLLDLGTGVGFIPMRLHRMLPGMQILAQDNRAGLICAAQGIAQHNDIDPARLTWADRAFDLNRQLEDFRPDVLRINIPDDVPPDVLEQAPLASVDRVIIAFNGPNQAATLTAQYDPILTRIGFVQVPDRNSAGSLQFDRQTMHPAMQIKPALKAKVIPMTCRDAS